MILLHRLTPFAVTLLSLAGFAMLTLAPFTLTIPLAICFALIPLLFARLILWEIRRPAFWVFLGTPTLLLVSSLMFFLLLEANPAKWLLGVLVTIALGLYAENLFAFYHLPSTYQAYSLEYLSLMVYLASAFFFTSSAYMAQLFLELPFWIPAIAVFALSLLATMAVFWVSKIGFETGMAFASVAAILMTQTYVALNMLPTSFMTNAAVFTIFWYLYLGLSRAHVLETLTPPIIRRYVLLGMVLLGIVFGTATWI